MSRPTKPALEAMLDIKKDMANGDPREIASRIQQAIDETRKSDLKAYWSRLNESVRRNLAERYVSQESADAIQTVIDETGLPTALFLCAVSFLFQGPVAISFEMRTMRIGISTRNRHTGERYHAEAASLEAAWDQLFAQRFK
jgi:hypothetical protein